MQRNAYESRREKEEEREKSIRPSNGPIRAPVRAPARFHKTLTSVVVTESRRGSSQPPLFSPGPFVPLFPPAGLDPFPFPPLDRSCTVHYYGEEGGRVALIAAHDEWRKPRGVGLAVSSSMSTMRLINASR